MPNWFTRLFGAKDETRSLSFQEVWGAGNVWTPSNGQLSEDQALRLVPVFAAARLLADGIASSPIKTYTEISGAPRPTPRPPLFTSPSATGTRYDWIHRCMTSLVLRGNAYGLITDTDDRAYPKTIEWLHPDDVSIKDNAAVTDPEWYVYQRPIDADQLVHIPGFVLPGQVLGLSPIQAFAMTANAGLGAQEFGANWFDHDATPSAVLESDQQITKEQAETIKGRFKAAAKGRDIVAMGAGLTYKPISVPADESQFLETIKATATQIAAIYGVPPERIGGEAGGSLTYSTLEQNDLSLNTYALAPYAIRLEEAFSKLLPGKQYVKFNLDARVRVDITTRYRAHQIAREIGLNSVDELRALEDLEPIPGGVGDDYTPLKWLNVQAQTDEDINAPTGGDQEKNQ